MWTWLKKNFIDIQDEELLAEIQKVVEDEELLKKRKKLAVSKFEKFLKEGGALASGMSPSDDVLV